MFETLGRDNTKKDKDGKKTKSIQWVKAATQKFLKSEHYGKSSLFVQELSEPLVQQVYFFNQ